MNLSQPLFSPQAAAILASFSFFPSDFISGDMCLHEVIEFPTYTRSHLRHPVSTIWPPSTVIAIFSYHCVRARSPFPRHPTLP